MKKFLGIIILTVIFVTDAYALLGGKKQQSSPDYIYVSNKDSKNPSTRLNIAKRHCSKFSKNTFHFKNDWYKGSPLPTGFRKKNFRYICALNSVIAKEILYDFIANKEPKKKYNKKIGKQKSIIVEYSSIDFETRTPEQIKKDKAEKERIIEEKRLAKIAAKKDAEKQKLAAIAKEKKIKNEAGITEQTTLIKINKKIIKSNLFPDIKNKEKVNFINLSKINKSKLNHLLNENKEIYFVTELDYVATSNIRGQIKKKSQMQIGETLVPNPELTKLRTEINNQDRRRNMAFRAVQAADAENNYYLSMNCGADWTCSLKALGVAVALGKRKDEFNKIDNKLQNLISKLESTPSEISRAKFKSYEYLEQEVDAKKSAIFKIVKIKDGNFNEKDIFFTESKKFTISNGINAKDKNYKKLKDKYIDINEIDTWQNKKLSSIDYIDFFMKINNEGSFLPIDNKDIIFSKLKDTKVVKIDFDNSDVSSKNLKKNSEDTRFSSVVVVSTNEGLGAGFYITPNLILTNYHVVENALNITIENNSGNKSTAELIKKDLSRDLALLKTNKRGKAVKFYNGELNQGSEVEALGHPRGLKFSLSKGTVSAIRMYSSTYTVTGDSNVLFIQTDAAINPGNSGGPLFFGKKVVGVNTQGLSKSENEGLNFAVHFSEVKKFLK
jgi:S1-C subfamily serine protease